MLRPTTAGPTARAVRLLLLPALSSLALACDSSTPQEPLVPDQRVPQHEGESGSDAAPTRQELAELIGGGRRWADGYAWATDPISPGSYSPRPDAAFNRTGRSISITKPAGTTGRYIVTFAGLSGYLGSRSTVHVSADNNVAYDLPNDTYCKPVTAYLVSDKIEVRCFRISTRTAANSTFRVLVTRSYEDLAFAYAHQPTGTDYSPSAQGSWNPAGSSKVIRRGVGRYDVVFNNLGSELPGDVEGHVQVNAVGAGGAHCKVQTWNGSLNLTVGVLCFTAAGQPVDSKFTVLFVVPSEHLAYTWMSHPTASPYFHSRYYSSNPAAGEIFSSRPMDGWYYIVWQGVDAEILGLGNFQVTAFGSDNTQCKMGTPNGGTGKEAEVLCFSATGAPANTTFTVLRGS
jgi:hypothetical protein